MILNMRMIVLLSMFLGKVICGQIPFASVSQAPLLLNPAMAGARNKARIATIGNSYISAFEKERNLYASYDQTLGNTGIGLGAYYHYRSHIAQPISEFLKNNRGIYPLGDYSSRLVSNTLGFSIAPKYNIKSRKAPDLVLFSLSPCLFFDYKYSRAVADNHFENLEYKQYSSGNPDGVKVGQEFRGFVQQSVQSNIYRLGMGLHLNASNWIALGNVSYEMERAKEDIVQFINTDSSHQQQAYGEKQGLFAINESLNLGFTFPRRKATKISVTPLVGIGCKQYLNLKEGDQPMPQNIYSLNLSSKQRMSISYLHASGVLRFKKILCGVAYTKSFDRAYYGPNIGLQSSKLKIIYSLVLGRFTFNEISMVVVI